LPFGKKYTGIFGSEGELENLRNECRLFIL
jgi:hypothetical protein